MKHLKSINEIFGLPWKRKSTNLEPKNYEDDDIAISILKYIESADFIVKDPMSVPKKELLKVIKSSGVGKFRAFTFIIDENDGELYTKVEIKHNIIRINKVESDKSGTVIDCDPKYTKEIYNFLSDLVDGAGREKTISNDKEILRRRLAKKNLEDDLTDPTLY